jgi:hypothetical protein
MLELCESGTRWMGEGWRNVSLSLTILSPPVIGLNRLGPRDVARKEDDETGPKI